MPRNRVTLSLALLVLVSCGAEKEKIIDTGISRLEFSVLEAPDASMESVPEIVLKVPIPEVLGVGCQGSNESVEIVQLKTADGSVPVIRFSRPGTETHLRIFQPVVGGEYDSLRLQIATQGLFLVRGLLQGQGDSISTEIESRVFAGNPGSRVPLDELQFQTVDLDFKSLDQSKESFSELILHKPMARSPIVIRGIELVRRGTKPLPSAATGTEFVGRTHAAESNEKDDADRQSTAPNRRDLRSVTSIESRPAVGLLTGERLAVKLGEAEWGEVFVVDAVHAEETRESAQEIELLLRGASGQVLTSVRHMIGGSWSPLRLPLPTEKLLNSRIEISGTSETRALLSCPRVERRQEQPRTILLITSDTHRADHLGFSSPPGFVSTPNIDAMKREGVSFLDCYSQANVTNPSHVALMTAFHPRDSGVVNNFSTLADEARTLAEEFADAGYMTFASVSAPHLAAEYSGLRQGFDRMEGPEVQPREAHLSVQALNRWLDEVEGAPVFAWLHLFDAHFPYVPPADLDLKYYPEGRDPRDPAKSLPLPGGDVVDFLKSDGITDPDYAPAQYRSEVDALDRALGPLFTRSRVQHGISAFTADHGEALGEHSIYCDHYGLYPASLHVPLVLRWPGNPRGAEVQSSVEMYDLGRTLLNLAEIPAVEFPGQDLRGFQAGGDAQVRPRFALAPQGISASVEEAGYLCVLHLKGRRPRLSALHHELGMVELFHLKIDPLAENDVVLENFERASAMREQILNWLKDESAPRFEARAAELDPGQVDALADLGYAGAEEYEGDEVPGKLRWWRPEEMDPNWQASPWRRLFEEEGFGPKEFREAKGR